MPYEYKVVEWSSTDPEEPVDIIKQETADQWEFYDSVQLHPGRLDFIFRQESSV